MEYEFLAAHRANPLVLSVPGLSALFHEFSDVLRMNPLVEKPG